MARPSRRTFLAQTAGLLGASALGARARSAVAEPDPSAMIGKAVAYLRTRQADDGSWSGDRGEPGITALVVAGLLRSGQVPAREPMVAKALAHLEGFLGPDGGLSRAAHSGYTTSVALLAFRDANADGRYDRLIAGAQRFLLGTQFDESKGTDPANPFYGGAGYGPGGPARPAPGKEQAGEKKAVARAPRPDLSNTAFMIEAVRESGLPADDPALKKAIVFLSRCQNLKGEFNDQPWADKINDGGFIYTPANGGTSIAGKTPEGYPLSYGSMTYAGLKSMIYAGLTPEDPRVKAALGYLRRTYSVDENPGAGERALFYYYVTFAKALAVLGEPTFADAQGTKHDWKADLARALAARQGENGSWVNRDARFMEGDPNLVTAYGLLALGHARPPR